jgi:acyl-CoA synthetase (AMP-forming)/AMP-acid ligase II
MAIFDKLNSYSNQIALNMEDGVVVTYSHLVKDADIIAKKIGRRCLIFIMCSNCPESVIGYVGFLQNYIVPVLLNNTINITLLNDLIKTYHPQYLYLPSGRSLGIAGESIYQYGNYTLIKLCYDEDYSINPDLALLLTTSGSTGSPKLVRQSYKNIQSNTESIIEYLQISEKDRAITTLPMSYTYGLSIITTHLYKGASIFLTNTSLLERDFWSTLSSGKITTFGGVPYTYEILKKLHFDRMELPDLRYITQAGGKLSKELAEEFVDICKKRGKQLIIMYGQTEATARMSYLPWSFAEAKVDSIGIAIPGGRFRIEDDDGKSVEIDESGELIYQGDNVTLGYAEDRFDLSRGDDNLGELYTGDMAKCDADGFYYIVGRKKRFLKLFGNRINLDEVENILKKEGVDCVCSGKDDLLKIYITNEEYKEKIILHLIKYTNINRSGIKVMVIDSIPRSESGKVLYSELL